MYGNEAAVGGATLASTGLALSTGSMILAIVAGVLLVSGIVMVFVRRHKLRGQRP